MIKVGITADAACDLSPAILKKYDIKTLKCAIRTKTGEFLENDEITAENLLEYIKRYKEIPEMLPISVEQYRDFFAKALETASSVCHISVGSKISQFAYVNALEASKSFDNVHVIDSKQLSSGMAFAIIEASRLASEGFDAPFICSSIEDIGNKVHTCIAAKDFESTKRIGAMKNVASDVLDLLSISPFFYVAGGSIKRTFLLPKAKGHIESLIKKELRADGIDTKLLFVSCFNPMGDETEKIRALIEKYIHFDEIIFSRLPLKTIVSMGESAVGLHFVML